MGLTFKENVRDIRNSKSFDIIKLLKNKNLKVDCYDKNVIYQEVRDNKINLISDLKKNYYDSVVILVPHKHIKDLGEKKNTKTNQKKWFYI